MVPATLFFVQNNVMYLALGNLDAATYQVTMQLRLITTAVMSVIMLGKIVSPLQWGSLFLLAAGVAVVQVSSMNASKEVEGNPAIGFAAVLFNCCSSAFGAVYFEKLLKGSKVSLWTRNVQMSAFSIVVGVVDLFINGQYLDIAERGYFHGFTWLTFVVIGLQSAGGILLALVMKYADNILKGFAMAIAILVSCLASYIFFDFKLSGAYMLGTGMVIAAATIYGQSASGNLTAKGAQGLLLDFRTKATAPVRRTSLLGTPEPGSASRTRSSLV
jgi:UDP-sugar transporter A1/2/3